MTKKLFYRKSLVDGNDCKRLSRTGLKVLLVARRSAFEMVAKACTVGGDVNSWFRVPIGIQTIQEAMRVYGLVNILSDKSPSDPAPALEAARDAMQRPGYFHGWKA